MVRFLPPYFGRHGDLDLSSGTNSLLHEAGGMMVAYSQSCRAALGCSATTFGLTQRTASMLYAMSGRWWPERLTIRDGAGTALFEVRNSPGFATMLSLNLAGGEEIATIRRRRGGRFQVIVRGKEAGLVRLGRPDPCYIHSALGPLAAAASVTDGRYSIACNGLGQASVSRQIADDARQTVRISVDVGDGDAVALLATVLAVEAVRYEHAGTQFVPSALLKDLPRALLSALNPFSR